MKRLEGRVGIIAGGGRGIGAATAKRLCAEGASVIIGDVNEGWAKGTAETINNDGGVALGVALDGTDAASQENIVHEAVSKFGGLDIYHSNLAGGTEGDVDALNCPPEVFEKSVAINLRSHLLATQAALPKIVERGGGAIIYTSSGAVTGALPYQVAYPMTKGGIHALARHVAGKWGRHGIRANVICPGLIMTEAVKQFMTEDQVKAQQKRIPNKRLGEPQDIAALVAFLASDDGAYVNGQVWHVNGGSQMRD
ncbi:MAG: SDR family oxidoreductase [Pseudomonadota bacterium]